MAIERVQLVGLRGGARSARGGGEVWADIELVGDEETGKSYLHGIEVSGGLKVEILQGRGTKTRVFLADRGAPDGDRKFDPPLPLEHVEIRYGWYRTGQRER